MGDNEVTEMWREHRKHVRAKRQQRLAEADSTGWKIHTEYHWSRMLNGKRLDYWPSRTKFMYEGRVMVGDVGGFIRNREGANEDALS